MTPISACKAGLAPAVRKKAAGFTLLEMLLVLTIIAMASILVVPNVGSLESRSFSAQARQATTLLNYARRMAVVRGMPSAATFYAVAEDETDEQAPAARNSVGKWESYGAAISYRDSTDQETPVEDKLEIIFYPEGGSTGGTLLLTREAQRMAIHVDPFTGRVSSETLDDE